MKNVWAWIFGGLFLAGLATGVIILNPQNILEKPMVDHTKSEIGENIQLYVIEVENCHKENCSQKIASIATMQNWPMINFRSENIEKRTPAQIDEIAPSESLYELLVQLSATYSSKDFPWMILEHINKDEKNVLSGFWPEVKQTFAVLQGYFSRQKKKKNQFKLTAEIMDKNEWKNFLSLIQKLKSVPGWSKNNKWQIVGYANGSPTFFAFDESKKLQDFINDPNINPYLIMETVSSFQNSKTRNPSQIDEELLNQLKGQQ